MRFTWDRPYHVDATKFAKAFWSDATPFETGVRETALSFRPSRNESRGDAVRSPSPGLASAQK